MSIIIHGADLLKFQLRIALNLSWFRRGEDAWLVKLDELKRFMPAMSEIEWLQGDAEVVPELEFEQDGFAGKVGYRSYLVFSISPGGSVRDWDGLLSAVHTVPSGRGDANRFHHAVVEFLITLFHPSLTHCNTEQKINEGRKRIDITFENHASTGFFHWLGVNYSAGYVHVECKNYSTDPGNPELDQLAGRFSPNRGRFGLLVARRYEQKDRFLQRCRDNAVEDRGFIIPLDDDDLCELVDARRDGHTANEFPLLRDRFRKLIF